APVRRKPGRVLFRGDELRAAFVGETLQELEIVIGIRVMVRVRNHVLNLHAKGGQCVEEFLRPRQTCKGDVLSRWQSSRLEPRVKDRLGEIPQPFLDRRRLAGGSCIHRISRRRAKKHDRIGAPEAVAQVFAQGSRWKYLAVADAV